MFTNLKGIGLVLYEFIVEIYQFFYFQPEKDLIDLNEEVR